MKNYQLPFLCFLFTTFSLVLLAQSPSSSIQGVVLDRDLERPLPFATIQVLETDPLIGVVADENGKFVIDGLPVGRYSLQVHFLGYETQLFNEVLLVSGKATRLQVYLKESPHLLEPVVVRPEKEKEKALNKMALVSARQLNMEEANKYAGGFDDPARLVASFAGVASNITSNGIAIRGNAPKGLLWRIEGIQVPNPNHFAEVDGFGSGGITALSSQMLGQSDFMTGAFPAEYGNALSGVFDLSIKNGNDEQYEHTFQAGFLGIDVASEGPFKKGRSGSYIFNYRYSTLGLIDVFLPEEDGLGIAYQDLAFKLHFPGKKAGNFSLWGLGLKDEAKTSADTDTLDEESKWQYYEDLESENSSITTGILGLTHQAFFNKQTSLKTVVAASINELSSANGILDASFTRDLPVNDIRFNHVDYKLSTLLKHKFNARHSNRSGLVVSNLNFDIHVQEAQEPGAELQELVREKGSSYLVQAFSQSSFSLGNRFQVNPGVHLQYFLLNKEWTIEPRLAASWTIDERQRINFGYGLHSQLEKLNFYFSKIPVIDGTTQPNKEMGLAKSHHFVLAYQLALGKNTHLRLEPYAQFLYDVPVVEDSYFSMLNLEDDFFVQEALVNKGKGRNIGIDLTLERFLNKGWYYLVTASLFDSQYQGGDGIWRDSRFNRQVVGNVLVGKEWLLKNKNLFNASVKFSYLGGDRLHPVDIPASLEEQDIVEDLSRPFADQKPDASILHLTLTYRINKRKHSSLWSLQVLNVLAAKENYGYRYNYRTHHIEPNNDAIVIPNLSYKIEF